MKKLFTPIVFAISAALLFSSCSLVDTSEAEEARIRKEKVDDLMATAKLHYDKGDYRSSYASARSAFDLDQTDIGAEMMMGWSLLQLRRYDDFVLQETEDVRIRGAKTVFNDILSYSPNEFRARQGLATISFNEHYVYNRKVQAVHYFSRKLKDFRTMIYKIPSNPESAKNHKDTQEFIRLWRATGGFQDVFEDAHEHAESPWFDVNNQDAKPSGDSYLGWAHESDILNQIPYYAQRGDTTKAVERVNRLLEWNQNRAKYWERQSLGMLTEALRLFEGLNRTRGNLYHYVLRDIGLCHIAAGTFFLQKEIDRAKDWVLTQEWWKDVPEHERDSELLLLIQDERAFKSNIREKMNEEFRIGIEFLRKFIDEDLEVDIRRETKVEETKVEYAESGDQNAVASEYLRLWELGLQERTKEAQNQRKGIILQALTLMVYPQFGNIDLDGALQLANTLENTDLEDPLPYLIRGMVFERLKEWDNAAREYELFWQKSSLTTDATRKDYALKRKHYCERKIRFGDNTDDPSDKE